MKRVLFFFLLILSIHFINAQPLSQRLDALLHEEVLKTSEVGIAVFDLTAGESVYRYQDDKLYRPASVEKIITSVTALVLQEQIVVPSGHLICSYSGDKFCFLICKTDGTIA